MKQTDAELLVALEDEREEDVQSSNKAHILQVHPPVEAEGKTWKELHLHEPTLHNCIVAARKVGKQLTSDSLYDGEIELVRIVAEWPEHAMRELPVRVQEEAREYVAGFEARARADEDSDEHPEKREPPAPEKTLIFDPPIKTSTNEYTEMRLREPKVGENRRYKSAQAKPTLESLLRADMLLLEMVSGWPRAALLRLPISRFVEATSYLTAFFTTGQPTGNSSQQI